VVTRTVLPTATPAAPRRKTTSTRVRYTLFHLSINVLTLPAFSALNDKAGTNVSRDNQEKITDFGRNAYEKKTG
jgi:hypothetical protein